jgi:hypothetical protein
MFIVAWCCNRLVLVAQLDRVSDYESEGRGFDSLRAHHKNAELAELADALDLGSSVNDVGVQVPYSAPI